MSKATAAWTEPTPTYHRPALRVLSNPRPRDEDRMRVITPMAVGLSVALWAAIISVAWLLV